MNLFVKEFESGIFPAQKNELEKLLNSPVSVDNFSIQDFSTIPDNLTNPTDYNTALRNISVNLAGLYAESNNIWGILSNTKKLSDQDIYRLKTTMNILENQATLVEKQAHNNVVYSNVFVQDFNTQTKVETNPTFYQNDTIPAALIDLEDGLLKLPADGDFNIEISKDNTAYNVYLDRIAGIPVGINHTVSDCFSPDTNKFWSEILQANSPLYLSRNQYSWIPSTYAGGTACRIKIELDKSTEVSEINIQPYGTHGPNLLAIGYTNENENAIADPTFSFGLSVVPGAYWFYNTGSFGNVNTGTAVVSAGAGPLGENIASLTTLSPTGSISITHGNVAILPDQGLEVSFEAKATGNLPIEVGFTYIGASGIILDDKIERIHLDSLGWTKVVLAFDAITGTQFARVRISIPPTFDRTSNLLVHSARLETIKQTTYYSSISKDTTIFMPSSVRVRRLYLVLSQEHYEFKSYENLEHSWNRLERQTNGSVLDWNREINRNKRASFSSSVRESRSLDNYLRGLQVESILGITSSGDPIHVYEYNIGATLIKIRHRQYSPRGRYVSLPINISGEIREVRLEASQRVQASSSEINYIITLGEDDTPEQGKSLANSLIVKNDTTVFSLPPASINYLDYTTWSNNASGYSAILWPGTPTPFTQTVVFTQISNTAKPGDSILRVLDTPVDLRGTIELTWQVFGYSVFTNGKAINFTFGISSDGITWDEQKYPINFHANFLFDPSNPKLLFDNIILNLSGFSNTSKQNVKFMRWTLNDYTTLAGPAFLIMTNLQAIGWVGNYKQSKFICAEESGVGVAGPNDFIVPVTHKIEQIDGSNRLGQVALSNYPYVNREKVLNLVSLLSSSTSGRTIDFDPNAATPKYLYTSAGSGTVLTTLGYRPLLVTLNFKDNNVTVLPDTIGSPKLGDILKSSNEIAIPISLDQVSQSTKDLLTAKGGTTQTVSSTNQSSTISKSTRVYQTLFKNIVTSKSGVSINCSWYGTGGSIPIDPIKIKVDTDAGIIQVTDGAPTNYPSLQVTYYYYASEFSTREHFNLPGVVINTNSVTGGIFPQNYPVTRNMTDYMRGTIPKLKPVNLDVLSPDYYPVYEYYVHPDGYIVFSQNLHKYSETPATITVEYDTLAIKPRLIVDFNRPSASDQTPYIDEIKLFLNVRRN